VGVLGLLCLTVSRAPGYIGLAVILVAIAYGVIPPMLMAWLGDLAQHDRREQLVGAYQTMGDLGSGLGPLVAYSLVGSLGTQMVYAFGAGLLGLTIPLILATRGRVVADESPAR
jgi:MFS family permease